MRPEAETLQRSQEQLLNARALAKPHLLVADREALCVL